MKKTLLSVLCIVISIFSFSQTQSGGMMIGGSLGYSSVEYENDATGKRTSFSPTFGYFVKENLMLGINAAFEDSRTNNYGPGSVTRSTSYGIGPMMRYYKFTSNPQFAFYAQVSFNVGFDRWEYATLAEDKGSSFSLLLRPGCTYFLTKRWAADVHLRGLSFNIQKSDDGGQDWTSFDFSLGSFAPSVGLHYYFGNN